ncbi:hypothetical protein CANARDRAFT_186122, partial [[Candida] arabinofermentans NRRL YB-2248]
IDYTGKHRGEMLKRPLRKMPIEFIKAKEIYDPSADLYKKIAKFKIADPVEKVSPSPLPNIEQKQLEEEFEGSSSDASEESDQENNSFSHHHDEQIFDDDDDDDNVNGFLNDLLRQEASQVSVPIKKIEIQDDKEDKDETMGVSVVTVPKNNHDSSVDSTKTLPDVSSIENQSLHLQSSDEQQSDEEDDDDDDDNDDEEYDEQADFEAAAWIANHSEDSDIEEPDPEKSSSLAPTIVEDSNEDPKFGFLPEDYEAFDVSQIQVTNIRLSADDASYYVKAPILFNTDDYNWWSKESFVEELIDNGLAHYRVDAFLEYLTSHLTQPDPQKPEESDYDLGEESSEEESDDDDDGMADLINFSRNQPRILDDPIDIGTATLKTKGKGKKKQLRPDQIEDLEMRQELMNQFMFRQSSKKNKHDAKQLARKADKLMGENFMLEKYPFELHVRDMKFEYDEFYDDAQRTAMRFPPLDPHGLKTLKKLADYYNLKSRKFGKGPKSYVVAIKSKRTYMYRPDKPQINRILKQRPIFKRSDVRTTKEEALQLKNKRKKSAKELAEKGDKYKYKEGELVAAFAPEIGAGNIGRKLLEKMGWATGEALGAEGNKGIIEPIQAKMKMTKIGIK